MISGAVPKSSLVKKLKSSTLVAAVKAAIPYVRIEVEPDEMNIRTTVVMLKAMARTGAMKIPLGVQLVAGQMNLVEESWRAVAVQYLKAGLTPNQARKRDLRAYEQKYQELNERFDWEERNPGKTA